jgi:hypothetical protein
MSSMARFPALAKPIIVPVGTLAASSVAQAGLGDCDYAVIEPAGDGVRVRAATVDEQLAYEQQHGLGCVTHSPEEFFAELDSAD